jgi:hypothetical protein
MRDIASTVTGSYIPPEYSDDEGFVVALFNNSETIKAYPERPVRIKIVSWAARTHSQQRKFNSIPLP